MSSSVIFALTNWLTLLTSITNHKLVVTRIASLTSICPLHCFLSVYLPPMSMVEVIKSVLSVRLPGMYVVHHLLSIPTARGRSATSHPPQPHNRRLLKVTLYYWCNFDVTHSCEKITNMVCS